MEYKGFYIDDACGNNIFSYDKRKNKKIYVAPLLKVDFDKYTIMDKLNSSDKIAFSEYGEETKTEYNIAGIKNFLFTEKNGKKIYIFDNHNHAFYFISCEIIDEAKILNNIKGHILNNYIKKDIKIPKTKIMIHFDQHKDMRRASTSLEEIMRDTKKSCITDKDYLSIYTNYTLNVGSFITPLIENNFIKDVFIVDSTYSMDELSKNIDLYDDVILDIDLDFFSSDMDYIDNNLKIELIKKCYDKANIVTICTSPYFIEFERAKKYLEKVLDICIY